MNARSTFRSLPAAVVFLVLMLLESTRLGASPLTWVYTLLDGSTLVDDCPICGRPTIPVPLRGSFQLRLIEETPFSSQYAVENLSCTASSQFGLSYKVTGHGTFRMGGEVAVTREMSLELMIDNGVTNRHCTLTNDLSAPAERLWPMLKIHLDQSNGTFTQVFRFDLAVAPLREIWFSTLSGFHAGAPAFAGSSISGGDLISMPGRVVASNGSLSSQLGIMPLVPDLGLDAVDILPGGEIAFSIQQGVFSESLGPLHEGDVLSNRGRVLYTYNDLIGAFAPQQPAADPGLDALHFGSDHQIYFSVARNFVSEKTGLVIGRGDLLSNTGKIIKSNAQLVSAFNPVDPKKDYGLDAFWVWPSGEIWFSTEDGFTGQDSQIYGPGDLLSDQGYVVFRNLEMVGAFAPVEDVSNFGLDSPFVVTDVTPPAYPPVFAQPPRLSPDHSANLQWTGLGQVFQLLRSGDPSGPYLPISDIVPNLFFIDTNAPQSQVFYQVQQW